MRARDSPGTIFEPPLRHAVRMRSVPPRFIFCFLQSYYMLLVTCCILSVAQYLLIIQAAPFGEELSKSNRSFLRSAKMAGLPLPSPTRSEVSESALSEDTIKISGRESIVWKHFDYDTEKNRSVCNIKETSSDCVCGKEIPGKFPTNLRSHLQKQHSEEYAALRKIEESAKKAKMKQEAEKQQASLKVSHQMTLAESLRCGTYYDKSSAQYCDICRKLAIFVGTMNVPCSIVQNLEFQDLLSTLDHRFHVPS